MGPAESPETAALAYVQYDKGSCRGAFTGKSCIPKRLKNARSVKSSSKNEREKNGRAVDN